MRILLLVFVMASCWTPVIGDITQLRIKIRIGESIEYDFGNNTYSVFFLSKEPVIVKFSLSDKERECILISFHRLGINNIDHDIAYVDKCDIHPKIFTTLKVFNKREHEIKINPDCENFEKVSSAVSARRVVEFLEIVEKIMQSKQEIIQAPLSDILYI
jgi:hypothetical protein